MNNLQLVDVLKNFKIDGEVFSIVPCGSGRMNKTFKVLVNGESGTSEYILQRINTDTFTNPERLMRNIELVTNFAKTHSTDNSVKVLNIVKTNNNKNFYKNSGGAFRVYDFVPNSVTYNSCIENPSLFYESGKIFGAFQSLLRDFDASQLIETIPNFHNTKLRYEALQKAIEGASPERLRDAKEVIEFYKSFGETSGRNLNNLIVDQVENGLLPVRVTHNDTKLNNVAFDVSSNKAVAVLDLDTVMPGPVCYDFGDAIRFGCNSHDEESTDFKNIKFNCDLFKTYTQGYISQAHTFLTKPEVDSLVDGALVMTYEVGLRFLTDFLNNDTYFGANYYDNNLNRSINQLALLTDMCKHEQEMHEIVDDEYARFSSQDVTE